MSAGRREGPQVDLPACTKLQLRRFSTHHFRLLFCPNVLSIEWQELGSPAFDEACLKRLHDFLCNRSHLQNLIIKISWSMGLDSLFQFVFCDAREQGQGLWQDIRSVEVWGKPRDPSIADGHESGLMVRNQQQYEKWWKNFAVTRDDRDLIVKAYM